MRLQRIYSSKLYVTSTRKDRIHAAMQDPINAELVQQIEDYLSDDAKQELEVAQAQESAPAESNPDAPMSDDLGESTPSAGGGRPSSGPSHSSFTGDVLKDFGDDELADVEPLEDAEAPVRDTDAPDVSVDEAPEAIESVTKEGEAITGSTNIESMVFSLASEVPVIKGTLNSMEQTSGVSRIELKPEELWIYYEDKVNIGDIMVDVIEALNGANYTYLSFSRLARSNNAIVFDILMSTTEPMKSVSEVTSED